MRPTVPRRILRVGSDGGTGGRGSGVAFLLNNVVAREIGAGPVRQIVKDGRWTVPVKERPKGWERLGVRE